MTVSRPMRPPLGALTSLLLLLAVAQATVAAAATGAAATADGAAWVSPTVASGSPLVVMRSFALGPYRWSPGHRGIDVSMAPGALIATPSEGVASFAGVVAGTPVVVVSHSGGLRSTLQPATAEVAVGQSVAAGAPVARLAVAASAHCPPHTCLHWGVLRGSTYLDPLSFLRPPPPPVLLPVFSRPGAPERGAPSGLLPLRRAGRPVRWQQAMR